MSKLLRSCLITSSAAFFICVFAVSETNAQINQILKQMESRYRKLKTLRTRVIYEKYDFILKESDKREGNLIYLSLKKRNVLLRVDWKKPEESLAIVDRQYVLYMPRLRQAIVGSTETQLKNISTARNPLAFINMSTTQLKANYKLKYLGAEKLSSGTKTWRLEITPKIAQSYKSAELWIDGNGMPVQMKVTDKNGDTSSVLLNGLKRNVRIKRTEFKINLPKGTRFIKN